MSMTRPTANVVRAAVADERAHQRETWDWDTRHSIGTWLAILGVRTGKLSEAALDPENSPVYYDCANLHPDFAVLLYRRAIQTAAVAQAMAEQLCRGRDDNWVYVGDQHRVPNSAHQRKPLRQ